MLVDDDGGRVLRLLEHLDGAGGESSRRVQAGDDLDAVERKIHNDAFWAKLWIWGWVGKDKGISLSLLYYAVYFDFSPLSSSVKVIGKLYLIRTGVPF